MAEAEDDAVGEDDSWGEDKKEDATSKRPFDRAKGRAKGRLLHGRTVTSLALPPRLSASAVRRAVEAVGCASLPSINGVPATVGVLDTVIDLTDVPCGVPGALALTGALRALGDGDGGGGGSGGGGSPPPLLSSSSSPSSSFSSVAALRRLAMGGTALGAEGGEMLAEALAAAACVGLERLLLPGASLGPAGVDAVCSALPPRLLVLDLGSNACGDRGAGAAGDALRRCPLLRVLGVTANDIGPEGARLLVGRAF